LVKVLYDYADAVRVRQKPLPTIGSWGIVLFPYGDVRNGVWLGSYYPSQMDALTGSQASGQGALDPFLDYETSFSGFWWLRDGQGNYAAQWPDGSWLTIGEGTSGTTLPTVYRHTVVNNQQQVVPFTQAERVSNPPNAYNFTWEHKSGTTVAVDTSGNVTVSGAPGASLTFDFGTATLTVNASGNITLAVPSAEHVDFTQGGGAASDFLVLVSKFISAFNAHTHPDPQGGSTGTPTTPLSSGDVNSTLIGISN
jgi:phage baseplate assembly protein gpV